MGLLKWNQTFSVKVDKMDEQHRQLFDLINAFYDEVGKQSQKQLILELIKGMKTYTILHFSEEEELMRQHNYPGLMQHKKEHDNFIQKVTDLEEKYSSGKMIISIDITNFLKDWINDHIESSEQRYSEYILR